MCKLSSASISLVVLDSIYKLNVFLNIFLPYCFHYVVVLLLHTFVDCVHLDDFAIDNEVFTRIINI